MTSASTSTATARPRPNCCSILSGLSTNALNTTIMIAAAAVITAPMWPMPSRTASWASRVRCHSSCMRDARSTS